MLFPGRVAQPIYLPGGTPVAGTVPFHRPPAPAPFKPAAPTTAGLATGALPAVPPKKFRAQEPGPVPAVSAVSARLALPAPEELGIGGLKVAAMPVHVAAPIDWNQAHQRLKDLGAVGFPLDRVAGQV